MDMKELLEKIKSPFPKFPIKTRETALLLIDMQKLAGTEWLVKEAVEKGIPEEAAREAVAEMDERINNVLANAQRILES